MLQNILQYVLNDKVIINMHKCQQLKKRCLAARFNLDIAGMCSEEKVIRIFDVETLMIFCRFLQVSSRASIVNQV